MAASATAGKQWTVIVGILVILTGLTVYYFKFDPKGPGKKNQPSPATQMAGGGSFDNKPENPKVEAPVIVSSTKTVDAYDIGPGEERSIFVGNRKATYFSSPKGCAPEKRFVREGKEVWKGRGPGPNNIFHDTVVYRNMENYTIHVEIEYSP